MRFLTRITAKPWAMFAVATVSLGLAGSGYAAWTSSLHVEGVVGTGSVDAVWDRLRLRESVEVLDPVTGALIPGPVPPEKKTATCTTDVATGQPVRTVSFTISAAYPSYTCEFAFGAAVTGTVPVHFTKLTATAVDESGASVLHSEADVDFAAYRSVLSPEMEGGFTCGPPGDLRTGAQLHQGDRFCLVVRIHLRPAARQGHTYRAHASLELTQWNLAGALPEGGPELDVLESGLARVAGVVSFPPASLGQISRNGELLTEVSIPLVGSQVGAPGMPAVPVYHALVGVPMNAEASARLSGSPQVAREVTVNLIPFQHTGRDGVPAQSSSAPPSPAYFEDPPGFVRDSLVYSTDSPFPSPVVTLRRLGRYRDLEIAIVDIAAGQYNPVTGVLQLFSRVPFEVAFSGGSGFLPAQAASPFEYTSALYGSVINSGAVLAGLNPGRFPWDCYGEEYLVVTHPDFRPAADRLRDWKRQKGVLTNVFEVGAGTVIATREEIQALIQDRFEGCLVRPSYVLLLGDAEFIDTWYFDTNYSSSTASDFPYSNISGGLFDILPDMGLGRIPADTLEQAEAAVSKVIGYEQAPPLISSFYATAAIASQFQCCRSGAAAGTDQRAFIEESRRAAITLDAAGKQTEEIYTRSGAGTPARFFDGTLLPPDLASPYPWSGSTQDIVDAFNSGRFLIAHRDHGWEEGWINPQFGSDDVTASLSNGNLTPVVYSVNCASCFFDNELAGDDRGLPFGESYFCERIIREDDGAVGLIGDTRDSNTWSNTAFMRGLFDATWQANDPSYGGGAPLRRLSDIMSYAKLYTIAQIGAPSTVPGVEANFAVDTILLYHVFGDPTLDMWLENPNVLVLPGAAAVGLLTDRVVVKYPVEGAVVTAHQVRDGELVPLGRAIVRHGVAQVRLVNGITPGVPVRLSASFAGAISTELTTVAADLSVRIDRYPKTVWPGQEIGAMLRLKVTNHGPAIAPGTLDSTGTPRVPPAGYMVDLVLSSDNVMPAGLALLPLPAGIAYAEDGLLAGGRVSRTPDLPGRTAILLSASDPPGTDVGGVIPSGTPPGDYFLCARVDPGNLVPEMKESNNANCRKVTVVVRP